MGCLPCPNDMIGSSLAVGRLRFHICRSISNIGSMGKRRRSRSRKAVVRYLEMIGAYTHFRIGITEFDGDVSHQLVLKPDGHNPRYRLHHCRFPVSDMSDRSYISSSIS